MRGDSLTAVASQSLVLWGFYWLPSSEAPLPRYEQKSTLSPLWDFVPIHDLSLPCYKVQGSNARSQYPSALTLVNTLTTKDGPRAQQETELVSQCLAHVIHDSPTLQRALLTSGIILVRVGSFQKRCPNGMTKASTD